MQRFFKKNDIFFNTSKVAAGPARLNYRANFILKKCNLKNKRILELGSHNGRFTYVCLKLGCKSIVGVEYSKKYTEAANANLKSFPQFSGKYQNVTSDLTAFLKTVQEGEYDIILGMGIFYHILDQFEILKEIKRIKPKLLIVDTSVVKLTKEEQEALVKPCCSPKFKATWFCCHVDAKGTWKIRPSQQMMEIWLKKAGFKFKNLHNEKLKGKIPFDYADGTRLAYYCRPINDDPKKTI
jgi:2-polyprenyl-3-methyl-5-hydroxy-6-metoxy-1,4-benzoquinol methylase